MDALLIVGLFVWVAAWMGVCVFHIGLVQIPLAFWIVATCVGFLLLWPMIKRIGHLVQTVTLGYRYRPGEHVIYDKQKVGSHPGPRSEDVRPAAHGEDYSYKVKKLWTVVDTIDDDTIAVVTRRGKRHVLEVDDPHLHKAGWLESLYLRLRWDKTFPPFSPS